uniref:Peptidase M24 C-terminal domain-containing protein n=1 Tax=Magallana gigas TaxID=29159 RepID=A0A8W8KR48_MAGGI
TRCVRQDNCNKPCYAFEQLVYIPYESKLIKPEMLTKSQVSWLKDYYKMVEKLVIPELNARNDTRAIKWLTDRTNTFFFGLKLIPLFQIRICIMFIIFIVCLYSLFLHVTSTS